MWQTWILRADVSPTVAVASGEDSSICGDCRLRKQPGGGRACYVNVGQAPASVWRAYRRGAYARRLPLQSETSNAMIRLGAYGDPAAVPLSVWETLTRGAKGWTGYTHQWSWATELQRYCMASVDTEDEAHAAHAAGWRTFRTRNSDTQLLSLEVVCPASPEGGDKLQCIDCMACHGTANNRRSSITIIAHGTAATTTAYRRLFPIPVVKEAA